MKELIYKTEEIGLSHLLSEFLILEVKRGVFRIPLDLLLTIDYEF